MWLGLRPSPGLAALAADLRAALTRAGQSFDAKPFSPHLTLARLRRPASLATLAAPDPAAWQASGLVLFQSLPEGHYLPLRTFPFQPL